MHRTRLRNMVVDLPKDSINLLVDRRGGFMMSSTFGAFCFLGKQCESYLQSVSEVAGGC
jgi:hypothetical protein